MTELTILTRKPQITKKALQYASNNSLRFFGVIIKLSYIILCQYIQLQSKILDPYINFHCKQAFKIDCYDEKTAQKYEKYLVVLMFIVQGKFLRKCKYNKSASCQMIVKTFLAMLLPLKYKLPNYVKSVKHGITQYHPEMDQEKN